MALAMGLKMKKWLTNSQFELREESKFFKKSFVRFNIIRKFVKVDRNVYKTANKSALTHTYQILLSSNQAELSSRSFTHFFYRLKLLWGEACQKRFIFYR